MAIEGLSFDLPSIIPATIGIIIVLIFFYLIEAQKINNYMYDVKYYELMSIADILQTSCSYSTDVFTCIDKIIYSTHFNKDKIFYEIYDEKASVIFPQGNYVCITFYLQVYDKNLNVKNKKVLLCEPM